MADPSRIKIMMLLMKGEMCVSDICQHFHMKQPSISHHLNILKNAKIVSDRKEGKEVYYSLNSCCIDSCCSEFMQRFRGRPKA
ncbi:MAG: winged helix-turn-helix transcriptional regulator [Nitrospinae bacterium]|nr:winged helix-turn-helix transcriptional regulator [Nitrospinota bacterium]